MQDGRIEYLIRLVEKSEISELEIWEGWGKKIRIAKSVAGIPVQMPAAVPGPAPAAAESTAKSAAEGRRELTETEEVDDHLVKVVAPMVGTFYRAAAPDAPPFVDVGTSVQSGQTLCIIEAMKIMNEIASEVTGNIRKIMVENAQPVEFGQTLFLVEKSV